MNVVPIQDVAFDDKATLAMGLAFDQACKSLRDISRSSAARETLAKRIIEAAKNGERDPARLYAEALKAFRRGDTCRCERRLLAATAISPSRSTL